MTKILPFALTFLAAMSAPFPSALAQAIPAGVGTVPTIGFSVPRLNGSFNYALNAAEIISTGYYNGGTSYSTSLSGDATYLSGNVKHPSSVIYSGGVLAANSGQPTTVFQSLALSQSYITKFWTFSIQDAVSYLPESPVSGLSGIPGVGDLGINPTPLGLDAGIGILTNYGPRVSNTVTGNVTRVLSGRLSAQGSGYQEIQRFIGDNAILGLNNSGEGGTGGLVFQIDGRSSLGASYNYSKFTFGAINYGFTTQSGTVSYSRRWTGRFSTNVYAGPQHIANTNTAFFGQPSTQVAAGASASYNGRLAFYNLNYSRGVNNGSGVTAGAFTDSFVGDARRQFGRDWSASGSLGYSRSTSLPGISLVPFSYNSFSAGAQGVRRIGRRFSGYVSYTLEHQSSSSNNSLNAFSGNYNIIGVGISYSPGSLFLSR